ncbi:MAG: C4-dicarboxylate TRAP transporter large permease protein DctM [Dehalococcoidia bacterium]|nr:C4-dicarboxylate TRAP transporter large permease protein DctM [Chloroflexota bacterium]
MALILLTIPIFFPVVMGLGFDPIWFGVIMVLVVGMGVITPPVAANAYVVAAVAKDTPVMTIFRGYMALSYCSNTVHNYLDGFPPNCPIPAQSSEIGRLALYPSSRFSIRCVDPHRPCRSLELRVYSFEAPLPPQNSKLNTQ